MKVGDKIKITYMPSGSRIDLIIEATIVELISAGKVRVDTEHQKGIVIQTNQTEKYKIEPLKTIYNEK